ncbi:glycoside hydrolase family 127 protein [Polychaeton citri CBS 116435]|uniref:Glycoside hydrolase family 127 protein n=1 Tax=Polychaeton citri CBS 116435 TaxID=1314669 RepID=A0A9P4Q6C8_9PEZI|nr:glycoside hydrolase family 127 protein [Polychaeton citri CBS 116435]
MAYPQVSFRNTRFTNPSLLSIRRQTVSKVTLQTQLDLLKSTGRYDCFKLEWHPVYDDASMWPVPKHLFWDSDIAKWIEGACYFLVQEYDRDIDETVQDLVSMVRSAQQGDGYLNVHYTVVEPHARWSNLRDMHELYNAGHMIEAALAHHEYYKNKLLLDVVERYVHLIWTVFGPGPEQRHGYPGHPEIELALFRLSKATGSREAYELSRYFIEERGNPKGQDGEHYYEWEREQRSESSWKRPDPYPVHGEHWYNQSHEPILQQASVEGHSVRAMYLLTAVADMVCLDLQGHYKHEGKSQWIEAANRLWDNMIDKKMYLTGGVGAISQWEGFGRDYFLPQSQDDGGCYSETCASIAVMMFAERLLQIDLDGRYADVMELSLYNTVMTAMSTEGKAFTYENQLASCEKALSRREKWFWCACCPPNVTRLFGSLGGYLWTWGEEGGSGAFVNVHLYASAQVEFKAHSSSIRLKQQSNWPWAGDVDLELDAPAEVDVTIRLRIPGWAGQDWTLSPRCVDAQEAKGYLTLPPSYLSQHRGFRLSIGGFAPRFVAPHPYTNQRTLSLARGPIVYCAEDVDNEWERDHFRDVMISPNAPVTEESRVHQSTGEDYVALNTQCRIRTLDDWREKRPGANPGAVIGAEVKTRPVSTNSLTFVPYYFRANRGGRGHMRVGLLHG